VFDSILSVKVKTEEKVQTDALLSLRETEMEAVVCVSVSPQS
jgi:hypothetical protein